jgi:mRNA interferase RelE/StbE
MYEVILTRRAHREFNKLSLIEQDRIEAALDRLSVNPRPAGIKKIHRNIYRVRTGDWRIIYAVFDRDNIMIVGKIARRAKDTYDKLKDLF